MLTLAPCPKWCRVCRLVPPHPALSPNSQQALRSQGACHPLIGKTCERDFCQRKSTTTIQCVRSYRELAEQIRHWQMKGFPRRLIPCHQQIQRQFYTKTMWMTIRRGRLVNWVELGDQPGWLVMVTFLLHQLLFKVGSNRPLYFSVKPTTIINIQSSDKFSFGIWFD